MHKVYLSLIMCLSLAGSLAQSGMSINTDGSAPAASAMLDVKSTDKGMLVPRMTSSQRTAITNVAKGLLVFDNTTSSFWFYNGTTWVELASGGNSPWTASGTTISNTNTGNVGIGTSAPTQKLDVNGNVRARGRIDASGVVEASGLSSLGAFYVAGSSLMAGVLTGNSSASFGGTISTSTGLSVTDPAGILQFKAGSVEKGFVQLSGDNLRLGVNSSNTGGKVVFRLDGADHVFIQPDGKIGIGQDSPVAKLHINSGSSLEALRLTGNNNTIIRFMTGATEKAYIYSANNHLLINTVQAGGQVRLGNEVYVDEDANRVGVGTSAPDERLHVAGNVKVTGGKVLNSDNINLVPIAMAFFDQGANKLRGTSNISAYRATANNSFRYFVVTVSGVTDLSTAIIHITGLGPQVWGSVGTINGNQIEALLYDNLFTEETSWQAFYITVYN